jgi:hypothetical protein
VCQASGLATGSYTFPYVAGWAGGDTKVVAQTGERVIAAAREILDRLQLVASPELEQVA